MEFVQSISSNAFLLALANIMAVVAAAAILYRALKLSYLFVKSAYHQNIRVAVRRFQRLSFILIYNCSLDIHVYVSYLVQKIIVFAFICLTLITTHGYPMKSRQEFIDIPPKMSFQSYEAYIEYAQLVRTNFFVIQMILVIFLLFLAMRLLYVAQKVSKIRFRFQRRMMKRAMSSTTATSPSCAR